MLAFTDNNPVSLQSGKFKVTKVSQKLPLCKFIINEKTSNTKKRQIK